jgi:hypothetical protein
MRGCPLMPTTQQKANKLLKNKNGKPKSIDIKKIHLLQYGKGLQFENILAIPPTAKASWLPCEAIR